LNFGIAGGVKEVLKAVSHYTVELHELIQKMYGVQSMQIDSVQVTHVFEDNTVWDGMIEVFELHGHPRAPIVYAWAQDMKKPGMPKKVLCGLTSQFSRFARSGCQSGNRSRAQDWRSSLIWDSRN